MSPTTRRMTGNLPPTPSRYKDDLPSSSSSSPPPSPSTPSKTRPKTKRKHSSKESTTSSTLNGSPTSPFPPNNPAMGSSQGASVSTDLLPSHPPPMYLLIYPVILSIASLFSLLSPVAKPLVNPPDTSTSTVGGTAHIPNSPAKDDINYFSSKRNILNIYFVKYLWFWATLAFTLLLIRSKTYLWTFLSFSDTATADPHRLRRTGQAILRYAIMTLAWILVTQWFFGPALIDRHFTWTGGACDLPADNYLKAAGDSTSKRPPSPMLLTAQTCKAHGGTWKGGHDISGHVFLLVLTSAFLALELLGMKGVDATFSSRSSRSNMSISLSSSSSPPSSTSSKPEPDHDHDPDPSLTPSSTRTNQEPDQDKPYHIYLAWTVVALSLWMLLMTGIWFHTFFEKLSGLTISLASIWAVYFLPRSQPAWRTIVGIPGQ